MSSTAFTANERSWAISLISDVNGFLQNKNLLIKKADGEKTINTGKKRMFPDVMLYGDTGKNQLLQGWEIKMPDVAITDSAFIKDGQRKAVNLNLNSYFLWNFTYGVLYVKDETGAFVAHKTWNGTNYIKTRDDVKIHEAEWKKLIYEIVLEINELFLDSTLRCADLGDIISDSVMKDIISRNKAILADNLKQISLRDATMRSSVNVWWDDVKVEYMSDEKDPYSAYSKTILLSWVNRILFAHMVKRFHNAAKKVEGVEYTTTPPEAITIFEAITKECDFFNVFKNIDFSEHLPAETWNDIVEFNGFLKTSNVELTDYSALQKILENTVATSRRAVIGQYATPPKLADLLVKMSLNDITGSFIDLCCGTGTISTEALKYKKSLLTIEDSCSSTWASDKNSFPLQITNLNMADPNAINIPNRIFQRNVFELNAGDEVQIIDPATGEVLALELPYFNTVSSNLPFVSSNREKQERKEAIEDIVKKVKSDTRTKLSKRSDLYIFILFKIWDILAEKGNVGVITSNSWLGTKAGKDFFNAIRWYYKVKGIYTTNHSRWFRNAKVIACILLLEKKELSKPDGDAVTNFGIIQKSLDELTDVDVQSIVNSSNLSKEINKETMTLLSYSNLNIETFLGMNIALNAVFHKIDWLPSLSDKQVEIGSIMNIIRGEKTGQDQMFYLKDKSVVDAVFLGKGLKTSSKCKGFTAVSDIDVFYCDKTIAELEALGCTATLHWISQFSNNLNKSVELRGEKGHMLSPNRFAILFTGMNPFERIFVGRFDAPTFINQRLIGLNPKNDDVDVDLVQALLNSIIGMFYIEAVGFSRGMGALDFSKENFAKIKMLNPTLLNSQQVSDILEAFTPILGRNVLKTVDELNSPDRIYFEKVVMESFGITQHYEDIKASLLSLQKARLSVRL